MTRPRFEAESSAKLFGALSARPTNGPARRFKESRESRPPINTRVKETVKISTWHRAWHGASRRPKKQLILSRLLIFIPGNESITGMIVRFPHS